MRRLYVFSIPKGEDSEEFDLEILDSIAQKFSLGTLKYYDKKRSRRFTYLYGRFSKGSVVVKMGDGLAMALIKARERKEIRLG
ncbi:MAG: hypothetical protein RXS23_02045 [Metallosphaera yellowstonensis]|jgi:hypothetical protein